MCTINYRSTSIAIDSRAATAVHVKEPSPPFDYFGFQALVLGNPERDRLRKATRQLCPTAIFVSERGYSNADAVSLSSRIILLVGWDCRAYRHSEHCEKR